MKKVILIPDSFKGTMSSEQICSIMKESILSRYPEAEVISIPVADGGEGSVDCFLTALGGEKVTLDAMNPRMQPMKSFYGLIEEGKTAVIEMAACAGLPLMGEERDPLISTTYGVGQQIADAARRGVSKIIVGLGGSATNDGGCGAAAAAGVKFYGRDGKSFVPTGGTLTEIERIDISGLDAALAGLEITAMCDIDNPLCGPQGAAAIFGPQKGATPEMVEELDRGLRHLSEVIKRDMGQDLIQVPGSGAAGGMGAGMMAFFGAKLQMGIDTVLDTVRFDSLLEGCDAIFTGEGKIDGQSLRGKVVIGVARRAKKQDIPVIAVVGDIGDPVEEAYGEGVSAIFSINRTARNFSDIKHLSPDYLKATMDNLMHFFTRFGL